MNAARTTRGGVQCGATRATRAPTLNPEENAARLHDAARDAPRSTADEIRAECEAVCAVLLAKNAAYGDSALDPLRLFSRADAREGLHVRIDDKLSRIARGTAVGEDVTLDLIGYLVLLRIAERRACRT